MTGVQTCALPIFRFLPAKSLKEVISGARKLEAAPKPPVAKVAAKAAKKAKPAKKVAKKAKPAKKAKKKK